MNKDLLINRLKKLNLNKKEFAAICKVPYSTLNSWGALANGKPLPVPAWVEPFLDYYEKAKKLDYVMDEICMKIKKVRD